MLTIQQERYLTPALLSPDRVLAVAFRPDGRHLFGGDDNGTRRWRLADDQEVRNKTGVWLFAVSVLRDHEWIVYGTDHGTSVWGHRCVRRSQTR